MNRPITPEDIKNVEFTQSGYGRKGYAEDEVDDFLDAVQEDLAYYIDELNRYAQNYEQAPQPEYYAPAPLHQPPAEAAPPTATASRILELAQNTADQLTNEAKIESDKVMRDARLRADELVRNAEKEARGMVLEAKAEADELQKKIQMLRMFEENYHERLVDYMENQLTAVKGYSSVEPAE